MAKVIFLLVLILVIGFILIGGINGLDRLYTDIYNMLYAPVPLHQIGVLG